MVVEYVALNLDAPKVPETKAINALNMVAENDAMS
jgi:hypothetical protein